MYKFSKVIEIIGVNPYVEIPRGILDKLFKDSKREKAPIPVIGKIQGQGFEANIVRYSALWRLYLNTPMRKDSHTKVGDKVVIELEFDPKERITPTPLLFQKALDENKKAKEVFEKLSPSRKKEILRYLGFLKTEEILKENIKKTIMALSNKKAKKPIYMRS